MANGQGIVKVSAKNDASRSERKTTELGAASNLARLREEPNQKTAALIIKLQRGSIEEVSRAIHGLHALGKKAIPSLIDSIFSDHYVANLLRDPTSSYIQDGSLTQFAGVRSAYVVELIITRETLASTKTKKGMFVLGPDPQNYLYDQATILANNKEPISKQDLLTIGSIYQAWWESNKKKSIEALRKDWQSGRTPLANSAFSWDSRGSGRANDEDVFAPVPASLRPRLVERLKQLIEYQRTQQWEKQYDMLSQLITQGDSKEQYVTQHQRWQAEGVESLILAFTPKSVTYQEGGPSDVVSFGCATLIEDGKVVERYASVAAYREKNDWYFSPVGMVTQIGSKPEPCPYSLAGGTMKR